MRYCGIRALPCAVLRYSYPSPPYSPSRVEMQIFFITDEDVRPLLGDETCLELNLIKVMASGISESETVNAVNDKVQTVHIFLTRDQILKEYGDVFEGLGCMDGPYHMELDDTVKPVVHPPRKVPLALRDRLK